MKENQHIEWKASWRDEYLKWICGFANAEGGVLHQKGQVEVISSLEKDGRLLQAGPFLDDDGKPDGRGMFVLRVNSRAEADAIAQADPYYRAGFRDYQIQPWRRSEGSLTIKLNIAEGRVEMN